MKNVLKFLPAATLAVGLAVSAAPAVAQQPAQPKAAAAPAQPKASPAAIAAAFWDIAPHATPTAPTRLWT